MKALTYHGPDRRTWGNVPDPAVRAPDDAVARVDAVTICGTDLHLDVGGLVTHRFGLDEMQDAYDVFADAADTGALKVALFRT
ncbi:hypothetical protein ACFV84_28215 [Kitasatospora sp. NPDC059811]|uniref:hypothetical protein n=1 Tax=Streptomycetaceae TaxID=2062 RepID=UPI0007AF5761|nr:hypothetical protein [Streptomyces sp. MJM8645]